MSGGLQTSPPRPAASPVAAQSPEAGSRYMWMVLVVSTVVQTTASFGNQALSPLAPFLQADLNISKSQVGSINTAFAAGGISLLMAAGWMSDRLGVRRMFLAGLLGCGIPLLLVSQAPTLLLIVASMLLVGLGNAVALPPTTRAIIYWFPVRRRGLAMGIKQTGVALAAVLMGPIIPFLAEPFGWRFAVAVIGWFTVLAAVVCWLLYREHPDAHASQTSNRAAGVGFGSLFRNRNLMLLTAASFCLAFVQLSQVVFMVSFLHERFEFDVKVAGFLLALASFGGIIGRIGWGVVSDNIFEGRRRVVMLIIAAGAALFAFTLSVLPASVPYPLLLALLLLTGITAIGWNGINMTFVGELAGRGSSASAAGLNLTGSYLGIIAGPPLFGWLVDISGSYTPAFVSAGILAIVAFGLLWSINVRKAD